MSEFDCSKMVDVVIAGLGPTGATLAHLLGKRGLSVLVLEREPKFYGNARAVYTDDECMRVLQAAGIANEIAEDMQVDTTVQFQLSDGSNLFQYSPSKRPNGWPVVNFFYQPWLETKLCDLLCRYPSVRVLRGREVVDFQDNGEFVTVTHQATRNFRFCDATNERIEAECDPDPQQVRARYLVGADGGRSAVREKLGIGMDGKNFPEPWLVIDLEMKDREDALHHIPYFSFICNPACPTVSCSQPGRFHRFEFRMMPGQSKEELEKPETVRSLISRYVDPDKFNVKRRLVYTFNALVAKEWRRGRILLAGDAAHMTPQFMGQGMSSGVRDAYNLAWKLHAILSGRASDRLLDTYGRERFHHAKAMIDISVKMKDFVSVSNPVATRVRNAVVKSMVRLPKLGRWLREGGFKPIPSYPQNSYFGLPRRSKRSLEGKLIPQPYVRTLDGKRVLFDEVLGDDYAVIGFEVNPLELLSAKSRKLMEMLNTRFVTVYRFGSRPQGAGAPRHCPAGLVEVEDYGDLSEWFKRGGSGTGTFAVVRPDKFAFAMVRASELNSALGQLEEMLGLRDLDRKPENTPLVAAV